MSFPRLRSMITSRCCSSTIEPSGLRAIVALHDTTLGPAVGGCRFWPYASEVEALTDVLRLSKGMTYKAAMADLPFGGGKTVIIGDPRIDAIRGAVPRARPGDPQPGRRATTPARMSARARRTWTGPARRRLTCWDARKAAAAIRRRSRRAASARHQGRGQAPLRSRRAAGRARRHPGHRACRRQPREPAGGGRRAADRRRHRCRARRAQGQTARRAPGRLRRDPRRSMPRCSHPARSAA